MPHIIKKKYVDIVLENMNIYLRLLTHEKATSSFMLEKEDFSLFLQAFCVVSEILFMQNINMNVRHNFKIGRTKYKNILLHFVFPLTCFKDSVLI